MLRYYWWKQASWQDADEGKELNDRGNFDGEILKYENQDNG